MAPRVPDRNTRPLLLCLHVVIVAVSAVSLGMVCRLMTTQSAPVDFALAVVAALMFAQRFER